MTTTPPMPTANCHACGDTTHGEHQVRCQLCGNEREYCCACFENESWEAECRLEYEHGYEPADVTA